MWPARHLFNSFAGVFGSPMHAPEFAFEFGEFFVGQFFEIDQAIARAVNRADEFVQF